MTIFLTRSYERCQISPSSLPPNIFGDFDFICVYFHWRGQVQLLKSGQLKLRAEQLILSPGERVIWIGYGQGHSGPLCILSYIGSCWIRFGCYLDWIRIRVLFGLKYFSSFRIKLISDGINLDLGLFLGLKYSRLFRIGSIWVSIFFLRL